MTEMAPLVGKLTTTIPAQAGLTTDEATTAFRAPYDATVSGVTWVPDAAMTGAATNNRFLRLRNRGQSGALGVTIAEKELVSGQSPAAFDEFAITLSVTAANLDVSAGDILEWLSDAQGSGIADPGGLLTVEFTRR